MTWNIQANSIFLDAIEYATLDEQTVFVERTCSGDLDLRREVLELLSAHQKAGTGDFLERSAYSEVFESAGERELGDTSKIKNDSSINSSDRRPEKRLAIELQPLDAESQFGRYRIEKVLGRGGMGVVYLAFDTRLKRRVALKIPRFDGQPELIERFEREAHTMASVSHRNLCAIYDVDELDGVRYLSMAFIDGESLLQMLERGERLAPRRIAEMMRKLALATQRAHQAGVVHRDLKPANVMIDREGEPVIMDFGLARAHDESSRLTRSGCIMGTPAYMAPEQALGDPSKVGPSSDIYSLGAILYELITGQPTFTGSGPSVIGQLVSERTPVPPKVIRPDIDHALEAICLRAIARRPQDRFETAEAMANELADYLSNDSVLSPRGDTATKHRHFSPSKSLVATLLVVCTVAAAIIVRMQSASGTLVAEIDDPAIVAQVQGQTLTIRDMATNKEYELKLNGKESSQPLPAGSYAIDVEEKGSGLSLSARTFQISRNDRRPAIKIWFEPKRLAIAPPSRDSEWSAPVNLGPGVNSSGSDENAAISADGLTLLFNRREGPFQQVWESRRTNLAELFGKAVRLPKEINTPESNNDCPFLSRDGLTLWFSSTRDGGHGLSDLWVSHRESLTSAWKAATNLGSGVNSERFEQTPFVTDDGLTLYFSQQVKRDFVLVKSTRANRKDPFEKPLVLANVNSGVCSSFPRLSADGLTMIFVHCRASGEKLCLCRAIRSTIHEDFGPPVELDPIINDAEVSGPSLSGDGMTLYFGSQRGEAGKFQLWSATRIPKR